MIDHIVNRICVKRNVRQYRLQRFQTCDGEALPFDTDIRHAKLFQHGLDALFVAQQIEHFVAGNDRLLCRFEITAVCKVNRLFASDEQNSV